MSIFLAAGGTGGHIFPALAVAEELERMGHESLFLGVGRELEAKLVGGANRRLETIPFVPVAGGGPLAVLRLGFAFLPALVRALRIFRCEKPSALLAFGGYPSFIPMVAAFLLGVPRAIHEQNGKVGLANRMLSLLANRTFAVPGATGFFASVERRVEPVPNPVRRSFYAIPDWEPPKNGEPFRILVVGGSQGARAINDAVARLAPAFRERQMALVHQTGASDEARIRRAYEEAGFTNARVLPFIENIVEEYAAAHLVICRAGAMTAAEVSAAGRPAIFVPLVIARAHQQENIRHLVEGGGALMLEQNAGLGEALENTLFRLLPDSDKLRTIARLARDASRLGESSSAEYLASQMIALGAKG